VKCAAVDLRLSAETARIGMQDAKNMAVGLLLKDNNLVVNVGSMELAGADNLITGKLGGELTISKGAKDHGFEANLTLSETSFASISQSTSVLLPFEGGLSLTLQMKAKGESQEDIEKAFEVEASAQLTQGVLKEVSLDKLSDPSAIEAGQINGVDEQTAFDAGEIEATIRADGNMDVTKFVVKTERHEFSSSGVIDLVENRLSLLGALKENADENNAEKLPPSIPFSLGGTVSKPKVTSINNKAL